MCPKFGLAAEEMLDGIATWKNRFDELAYNEFAPKYLTTDRVIKDGRETNSTGRKNGQRQESNNQGHVEYIGLAKVKHGSPAEKPLKTVAKERFEQPAKAPFSGKPLKKEAFIIPEQLTSNELKITYPNGKTYKDYVKTTDIIERSVHHFRDCFDKDYSGYVVHFYKKGKKTDRIFDKSEVKVIWTYDKTLSMEENQKNAQEFIRREFPYLGFIKRSIPVKK